MADVDPIVVKIQAEFNEFKKDLGEVKKGITGFEKSAEKAGKSSDMMTQKLSSMAKKLGAVAAGFVTVNAALGAFNGAISRSREITLFSDRLGVARERFGAYSIIARQAGAQTEDLYDSMKDLNVRITDAAGGMKGYEEVLNKVGLRSKDLKDLNPEEQFLKFAEALQKVDDNARLFAIDELLSDPGVRLNKVFKESGGNLKNMADELIRTGRASSEIDYERLQEAAKAQRELSLAWEKFANTMSSKIAPVVTAVLNDVNELMDPQERNLGVIKKEIEEMGKALEQIGKGDYTGLEAMVPESYYADRIRELSQEYAKLFEAQQQLGPVDVGTIEASEPLIGEKLTLWQQYWDEQSRIREEARESELTSDQAYFDLVYANEQAQANRINQLWAQGYKGRMVVANEFFTAMSALMQTENRKMFEIGKAAAIAGTVLSTIESAQKSFNALAGIPIIGPALGGAAATAAIAGGMARVQQLQSTTMGGGGGVGGGAGAVGGGGGAATPAPVTENVIDASFNIQSNSGMVSTDQLRSIASGLNDLTEDGFKIRSVKVI